MIANVMTARTLQCLENSILKPANHNNFINWNSPFCICRQYCAQSLLVIDRLSIDRTLMIMFRLKHSPGRGLPYNSNRAKCSHSNQGLLSLCVALAKTCMTNIKHAYPSRNVSTSEMPWGRDLLCPLQDHFKSVHHSKEKVVEVDQKQPEDITWDWNANKNSKKKLAKQLVQSHPQANQVKDGDRRINLAQHANELFGHGQLGKQATGQKHIKWTREKRTKQRKECRNEERHKENKKTWRKKGKNKGRNLNKEGKKEMKKK